PAKNGISRFESTRGSRRHCQRDCSIERLGPTSRRPARSSASSLSRLKGDPRGTCSTAPGPSTRTSPFTQLPLYCYEKGRRSSVPTTPPRCTPLRIMLSPRSEEHTSELQSP